MTAHELLDHGDLKGTIAELTQGVRANPADVHLRSFLFEALCFDGALDRAAKQLDALETQAGAKSALAFQVYRSLLTAEASRRRVFSGASLPQFYTPPPQWLEPSILLLTQLTQSPADAAATIERAEHLAPTFAGRWNGDAFSAFRDPDDRTAGVLEVFRGSDYLWLPFSQLRRVDVTPPQRLRDLLWTHARIETIDGQSGDVYLPVRYANSDRHEDDQVRLARATDWSAVADAVLCGAGVRLFTVDDREVSLLDTRTIEFDHPASPTA